MNLSLKILPANGYKQEVVWKRGFPEKFEYRIGFAPSRFVKTSDFEIVSQVISGSDYSVELLTLSVNWSGTLLLQVNRPVICIAFLLKGDIGEQLLGQARVRLGAGTYNLFYLPEGDYRINLLKDQYILLNLFPPGSLLREMAKEHLSVRKVVEKLSGTTRDGEMLEPFHFPSHLWRAIKQIESRGLSGVSLDLTIRQYIIKLLALYHQQLASIGRVASGLSSTQKAYLVRDYILKNFRESGIGGVTQLAAQFHITPKSLTREFQRLFNRTVPAYIKEERLEWAYLLLLHDNKSISDVALMVGYSDPANFTREFKKRFKLSPGQLRVRGRDI